jgi:hypothetical protein
VPFLIDFTSVRSENHSERTADVSAIVLHTGEGTRASDLYELTRTDLLPSKRKSSHYYVDRAGGILQLVDDNREAWHAGESHYIGSTNWNAFSIGIETEHARGQNWPAVQIDAIRWLITTLAQRHGIATDHMAAHRWIAPTRKLDPTDLHDLQLNDLFAATGRGYARAWRPYRVTANGSRVRATPTTNGAIHQTLNVGATFWATPVAGASVGRNTTWLALRYGGYMHSSLPAIATDLEQPKPPIDLFAEWGPIGKPQGEQQGYGVPQEWLKNKAALGACRMPETFITPTVSVAVFERGLLYYLAATHDVKMKTF